MINRSTVKYYLKKILPRSLFKVVQTLWSSLLLRIVEYIDKIRLKKFTTYHVVSLTHRKKTFSLFISPDNGFIDNYIYLYGVYEPFMLDLISVYLTKGMVFVDIGANIGQHSMYAATLVGKEGSVYSYEPIPFIYKQLQDSVAKNNFGAIIHTKNIALGNKDSSETIHISRKNVGGSSLVNKETTSETATVVVKKGDTELSHIHKIDVMKIDVEGYEYEVLEGIQQKLNHDKPVLFIEFSGSFYLNAGTKHGEKIVSILRDASYSIFDIEDEMKKITDDQAFLKSFEKNRIQTNLLCVSKQ